VEGCPILRLYDGLLVRFLIVPTSGRFRLCSLARRTVDGRRFIDCSAIFLEQWSGTARCAELGFDERWAFHRGAGQGKIQYLHSAAGPRLRL